MVPPDCRRERPPQRWRRWCRNPTNPIIARLTNPIEAAIGDGTVFRVQKQQHELDALDFTTGRKLFASWRPEHTYILPRS